MRVAETDAHEGPVYVADEDALYFTSVPSPKVAIRRLDLGSGAVETVRADANAANGMALGPDGRLVVCEQGSTTRPARIARVDRATGASETVVEEVDGLPLASPNDVVVARDGAIWFTDPSYGFLQGFRPEPPRADVVLRHDPRSGATTVVADGFDTPNGLAFAPDEGVLYVGDSGANQTPGSYDPSRPHRVEAFDVFDVFDGERLARRRVVADVSPGFPDGIEVDGAGRVYVSCASGVLVLDAEGEVVAEIHLPGAVNFTWGDPAGDVLLITTDTAIWAATFAHVPEEA